MRTIFLIGGMGAGKSTARKALTDLGVECVDFDAIGHNVLELESVKMKLAQTFGADVLDENGNVDRHRLAVLAFSSEENTELLNSITLPPIEQAFLQRIAALEAQGCKAVVAESSNFRGRDGWLVRENNDENGIEGDIVIAITAPVEQRIARAVAAGWDADDVRRRIARQPSDDQLAASADVIFCNDGTPDSLRRAIADWYTETIARNS